MAGDFVKKVFLQYCTSAESHNVGQTSRDIHYPQQSIHVTMSALDLVLLGTLAFGDLNESSGMILLFFLSSFFSPRSRIPRATVFSKFSNEEKIFLLGKTFCSSRPCPRYLYLTGLDMVTQWKSCLKHAMWVALAKWVSHSRSQDIVHHFCNNRLIIGYFYSKTVS